MSHLVWVNTGKKQTKKSVLRNIPAGECEGPFLGGFVEPCTGYRVPGAMVSVICHYGLNRSVREFGLTDPGQIPDKTREIVLQEFQKSDEDIKDVPEQRDALWRAFDQWRGPPEQVDDVCVMGVRV